MTADDERPPAGADDAERARAANPGSDPLVLARLAEERTDLHPVLAANPSCPVYILEWLHSLRDPAVDRALATNRTATVMGIVKPPAAGASLAPPSGAPLTTGAGVVLPPGGVVPPPPPPTAVLPTVPGPALIATPPGADATPTSILRPDARLLAAGVGGTGAATGDDDDEPEPERRRGAWLVLAVVPLLFLGGCLAAVALARGGNDNKNSGATATSKRPTVTSLATAVLPTQVTNPSTPATAAATTGAATAAPPASADAPATEPAPDPTDAATSPPRTTRPVTATAKPTATTAKAVTTTAKPAATSVAASSLQSFAYATAQQLATALATGDWARVRTMSPTAADSDAAYQAQYGNLDDSTVVPSKATSLSATTYALRLGLVAHETNNGVKQTSLYCAHWNVDTAKGTVAQVSGTKVRTVSGTKAASTFTAELAKTCATVALA